ncbi:MAG: ABC transporter substrate-binding protein [Spirochaetales bacterium]|nr:ABC transporter substrate-binding protein [Spirochaetales bacterium]
MKRVLVIAILLLSVCVFTFAGGQNEDEIVIGVMQDLSGPTSVWGNAVKNGAELAVDMINADGGLLGKQLVLKSYDIKLDPQEAINAYNRLSDSDKATAIVGPPLSGIGLAIGPLAESKKVPVVGSFIDPRVTVKEDGSASPYMFLMQPSSKQYAEILADYTLKKLGLKTVAVFYDQSNAFAVSQVKPFIAYFEANGGKVLAEEIYKKGDKDFKSQLNKIKNVNAAAIYAPNYVQDLVITLQQCNQIGLDVPFIGGLDFAPPFVSLLSDPMLADDIFFANNYSDNEPQLVDVRNAYKAKFGEEPINKAYLGYDKILIIADAIRRAGSADSTAVRDALETTTNLACTTGNITISAATHQPQGLSMVMYSIKGGKYADLGRHVPALHK